MLRMSCVPLFGPKRKLVLFWNGTLIRSPTGFCSFLANSVALSPPPGVSDPGVDTSSAAGGGITFTLSADCAKTRSEHRSPNKTAAAIARLSLIRACVKAMRQCHMLLALSIEGQFVGARRGDPASDEVRPVEAADHPVPAPIHLHDAVWLDGAVEGAEVYLVAGDLHP